MGNYNCEAYAPFQAGLDWTQSYHITSHNEHKRLHCSSITQIRPAFQLDWTGPGLDWFTSRFPSLRKITFPWIGFELRAFFLHKA